MFFFLLTKYHLFAKQDPLTGSAKCIQSDPWSFDFSKDFQKFGHSNLIPACDSREILF